MMPSIPDLLFVAIVAVGWPLYEQYVDWPRFLRWLRDDPASARVREYRVTVVRQWALAAVGAVLWTRAGRSWAALGLVAPRGWRLWVSLIIVLALAALNTTQAVQVARSEKARTYVRRAAVHVESILPHTRTEFRWFLAVSVTAGVCEEFLFRGYVITALAPVLTWWGAAALQVPFFGWLHAYQGRTGIVRTAMVGAVMAIIVGMTHSLVPAMVLHALVDIGSGVVSWVALREG
jgi:membrane protease YdiL (CAAX protease family)